LGVMPVPQALEAARKRDLDLVEVAPNAVPPVCRILDYGKYRYEQARKEREAKKNQKVSLLRGVRLRPKIGTHDFETKSRLTKKLLEDGDKVKVTVMFRGHEIAHPDIGWRLLMKMAESVNEVATIDKQPWMDGKRMNIILSPTVAVKTKVKQEITEANNAKN